MGQRLYASAASRWMGTQVQGAGYPVAYFPARPGTLLLSTKFGKEWCHMTKPHCLLCGREFPTGLSIMGCFLCFPCEKRLMQTPAGDTPPKTRQRLLTLYCSRGS